MIISLPDQQWMAGESLVSCPGLPAGPAQPSLPAAPPECPVRKNHWASAVAHPFLFLSSHTGAEMLHFTWEKTSQRTPVHPWTKKLWDTHLCTTSRIPDLHVSSIYSQSSARHKLSSVLVIYDPVLGLNEAGHYPCTASGPDRLCSAVNQAAPLANPAGGRLVWGDTAVTDPGGVTFWVVESRFSAYMAVSPRAALIQSKGACFLGLSSAISANSSCFCRAHVWTWVLDQVKNLSSS